MTCYRIVSAQTVVSTRANRVNFLSLTPSLPSSIGEATVLAKFENCIISSGSPNTAIFTLQYTPTPSKDIYLCQTHAVHSLLIPWIRPEIH